MHDQEIQIEQYLLTAIRACQHAGRAILEIYKTDFHIQIKGDHTPVTLADQEAHGIIVSHLQETSIPIMSEEGKDIPYEERKKWTLLWMVDPLDGTKEFIKKNGEFTVNIGLIREQKTILGVIFVPAKNALYFGGNGFGSFKIDYAMEEGVVFDSIATLMTRATKLPFSPTTHSHTSSSPRSLVIVGSRSHANQELRTFVEEKNKEYGTVDFISVGSALKFCLLAEGKADMYPRLGPTMEWDTAAGQAIAENAGKRVLAWKEEVPLVYNKKILQNPPFIVV